LRLLLSVPLGFVVVYVAGLLSSVLTLFGPPERLLATLAISLFAGGVVFFAWRWTAIALKTGLVVLALGLIAIATMISGPAVASLSLPDVLAHGATSPFTFVIGVVMVCCSVISRLPRKNLHSPN